MEIINYEGDIPRISTHQMIEIDRLMIEEYHIELIQMMENAGRCLALLAVNRFLEKRLDNKKVVVLAGTGGNGGGALVCARRLHNWGVKIKVCLTDKDEQMTPVPGHQLKILRQMGLDIKIGIHEDELNDSWDLIIDGIIGYSVKGDPYGIPKDMINWANQQRTPVLSLDTPSGLDLSSGLIHNPTVSADATLTLALPKQGLFEPEAMKKRGELFLADISVPTELYLKPGLGIEVNHKIFAQSDIVKINDWI